MNPEELILDFVNRRVQKKLDKSLLIDFDLCFMFQSTKEDERIEFELSQVARDAGDDALAAYKGKAKEFFRELSDRDISLVILSQNNEYNILQGLGFLDLEPSLFTILPCRELTSVGVDRNTVKREVTTALIENKKLIPARSVFLDDSASEISAMRESLPTSFLLSLCTFRPGRNDMNFDHYGFFSKACKDLRRAVLYVLTSGVPHHGSYNSVIAQVAGLSTYRCAEAKAYDNVDKSLKSGPQVFVLNENKDIRMFREDRVPLNPAGYLKEPGKPIIIPVKKDEKFVEKAYPSTQLVEPEKAEERWQAYDAFRYLRCNISETPNVGETEEQVVRRTLKEEYGKKVRDGVDITRTFCVVTTKPNWAGPDDNIYGVGKVNPVWVVFEEDLEVDLDAIRKRGNTFTPKKIKLVDGTKIKNDYDEVRPLAFVNIDIAQARIWNYVKHVVDAKFGMLDSPNAIMKKYKKDGKYLKFSLGRLAPLLNTAEGILDQLETVWEERVESRGAGGGGAGESKSDMPPRKRMRRLKQFKTMPGSSTEMEESNNFFNDFINRRIEVEEEAEEEARALQRRRQEARDRRTAFLDEHPNGRKSEGALRVALRHLKLRF